MFSGLFSSQPTNNPIVEMMVQEAFVCQVVRQGEKWRVSFAGSY